MFEERDLGDELAAVREEHAPGALVLDCDRDFGTLDPAVAEDLGLLVRSMDPASYPAEWIPADAPEALARLASDAFTVGMSGDGGVAWTRQTEPPAVLVKPRLRGSPEPFVAFLIAEALVEVGVDVEEHFLGFFGAQYPALADATPLDPSGTYQLAAALSAAFAGLSTRETFAGWEGVRPGLFDAWADAGERLEPRLEALSTEVARGETAFPAAAELACSAVKHDVEVPPPFAPLDTAAYRHHGAGFALEWARKTFEKLE